MHNVPALDFIIGDGGHTSKQQDHCSRETAPASSYRLLICLSYGPSEFQGVILYLQGSLKS